MNLKINGNNKIIIWGLGCITLLEIVALYKGINGMLLAGVIGVIAAAIGVTIPTPKWIRR